MIRDLNRQKTKETYQRHMVIAHIIVAVLMIGSMLIFELTYQNPEAITPITVTNVRVPADAIKTASEIMPARRNLPNQPVSKNSFQGQFGAKIRIVSESYIMPEINPQKPVWYTLDRSEVPVEAEYSVSDTDDGEYGAFVPDNVVYEYDLEEESSLLLTSGPRVIYREKPRTPPSAQMMGMGGIVEVLMLIDPNGKAVSFAIHNQDSTFESAEYLLDVILNDGSSAKLEFYIDPVINGLRFITIKDEPSDFKFSQYLYEVLPKWQFTPAIENGEAVYCFVHLHYSFCAPDDADCIELVLSIT